MQKTYQNSQRTSENLREPQRTSEECKNYTMQDGMILAGTPAALLPRSKTMIFDLTIAFCSGILSMLGLM